MSETPRTDQFYGSYLPPFNKNGLGHDTSQDSSIDFARSLERDLSAALKLVEEMRELVKAVDGNWISHGTNDLETKTSTTLARADALLKGREGK